MIRNACEKVFAPGPGLRQAVAFIALPMDHPVKAIRLTAVQFRLLQRVSDGSLSPAALPQARGYGVAAQIRTLRFLVSFDLVVERQSADCIRFEITDTGRVVIRSEN
jgi:hypothetical protein